MSEANTKFVPTHEQGAFKNAFERAIGLVGSARRMAEVLGVSEGQVSRWKHHHYDEHVPAALHGKIDAAAGHPCMLETQASLSGFSIRRDDVSNAALTLLATLGDFAETSGSLVRTVAIAKADDHICLRDLNLIEAEGNTCIVNVKRIMESARAKHEQDASAGPVRLVGGERNG